MRPPAVVRMDTQRLDSQATNFGCLWSGPRDEQHHAKTRSETSVLEETSTPGNRDIINNHSSVDAVFN